jgi:hypothetical protein
MRGAVTAATAFALCGALLGGCGVRLPASSKACTEVGCADGLTAMVTGPDAALPAGLHLLTVTADGTTTTCTFKVPSDTLPGGGTVGPSCPPGLGVSIGQQSVCTEKEEAGGRSLTCTPVAGQSVETISLMGAPAHVHLVQTMGTATVLDVTVTPTYLASQPNGPGCDPTCHEASAMLTFSVASNASP